MLSAFLLLPLTFSVVKSIQRCGAPGRPPHGNTVLTREGFVLPSSKEHHLGDVVEYSCPGKEFSLLGPRRRVCTRDGVWTPELPSCELNLSGEVSQTLQSATVQDQAADLAVDGDTKTCAVIERTSRQRWWQLKLENKIKLKAVRLHMKRDPLVALTIFTIEMLPHNRTLYKLCGRYNYTSRATGPSLGEGKMFVTDSQNSGSDQDQTDSEELVVDVTCDSQDAKGHYIFIRDDRKKVDYFRICEVEVFEFDKRVDSDCGSPELPPGSVIEESSPERMVVSCVEGLHLNDEADTDSDNVTSLVCSDGSWNSTNLRCQPRRCPDLSPVTNGSLQLEFDVYDVEYVARVVCRLGFITWGQSTVSCVEGEWSSSPASCRPLSCGLPPRIDKAKARLENGTTLWNDEAVYGCDPGYLMVVNDSSARDYARVTCSIQGEWVSTSNIKCVDATQLDGFLSDSARVSINIIYSLLALLIIFSLPLLIFYCWSRRRRTKKKKPSPPPGGLVRDSKSEEEVRSETGGLDSGLGSDTSSPRVGVYSVSSGMIIQPATVSPNTLRSLSSGSTFKPFSYTSQPTSLPFNNWQTTERRPTKSSLPFQFESPILTVPSSVRSSLKEEPMIDEAGYASLVSKQDPVYEPLREARREVEEEEEQEEERCEHTYDDVPHREHEYANMMFYNEKLTGDSATNSSFPDLLEMVTKTPSPMVDSKVSSEAPHLYAKVDMSRKRSRPSSTESQETVLCASNDSYTKTLIEKFNQFLEQSGQASHDFRNSTDKRLN